jgi:hypothetical protein
MNKRGSVWERVLGRESKYHSVYIYILYIQIFIYITYICIFIGSIMKPTKH